MKFCISDRSKNIEIITGMILDVEEKIYKGEQWFLISEIFSPVVVVFEDTGESGHFYAVNRDTEEEILDDIIIYRYTNNTRCNDLLKIQIYWNERKNQSLLFINDRCEAIIDFRMSKQYVRNLPLNTSDSSESIIPLTDHIFEMISR